VANSLAWSKVDQSAHRSGPEYKNWKIARCDLAHVLACLAELSADNVNLLLAFGEILD
jgi:hypothetical protein